MSQETADKLEAFDIECSSCGSINVTTEIKVFCDFSAEVIFCCESCGAHEILEN